MIPVSDSDNDIEIQIKLGKIPDFTFTWCYLPCLPVLVNLAMLIFEMGMTAFESMFYDADDWTLEF
jgi:hypothetical protein